MKQILICLSFVALTLFGGCTSTSPSPTSPTNPNNPTNPANPTNPDNGGENSTPSGIWSGTRDLDGLKFEMNISSFSGCVETGSNYPVRNEDCFVDVEIKLDYTDDECDFSYSKKHVKVDMAHGLEGSQFNILVMSEPIQVNSGGKPIDFIEATVLGTARYVDFSGKFPRPSGVFLAHRGVWVDRDGVAWRSCLESGDHKLIAYKQ
jgi:hypothetical protein